MRSARHDHTTGIQRLDRTGAVAPTRLFLSGPACHEAHLSNEDQEHPHGLMDLGMQGAVSELEELELLRGWATNVPSSTFPTFPSDPSVGMVRKAP